MIASGHDSIAQSTPRADTPNQRGDPQHDYVLIRAYCCWRASAGPCCAASFAVSSVDAEYAASRFEHHLGHWQQHGFGLWRAQERSGGDTAGWVGPSHPTYLPELADAVEIGWALRRPFWGRGLAGEGAAAAIEAAFGNLRIEQVISLINPSNRRSIAVARAADMKPANDVRRPDTGELMTVYERNR